jgi:hypothetical protein
VVYIYIFGMGIQEEDFRFWGISEAAEIKRNVVGYPGYPPMLGSMGHDGEVMLCPAFFPVAEQ